MKKQRHTTVLAPTLLLLLAVFITSCALLESDGKATEQDKLRAEIMKVVPDAPRRDSMLEAFERMAAYLSELHALGERHRDQFVGSVRNYETTRRQLEEQLTGNLNERQAVLKKFADAHYDFKSLATEQEWKKLAVMEKKSLSSVAKELSYGGES